MRSLVVRKMAASFLFCVWTIPALSGETIMPGSDPGSNATGEITAFKGMEGLACPADYQPGDYLASPFRDEEPLFRIDHTNVAEYENRLSPGQIARIKRNENFYLNIYPTQRRFVFPDEVYAAIEQNMKT